MKPEEVQALPAALAGDFKSLEPHLRALDKHLTLRTYVEGYALGETETKIWQTLKSNNAGVGFIKKGSLVNLTRWFNYISQAHPEIQAEAKAAEAARKAKIAAGSKAGGNFDLALQNADQGVVTRFLPEPSGYLHIGHAKAALLSDYFAHEAYKGQLRLRLDDTNPSKESEEFQDSIRLITEGHAYSDDTDQETMKAQRMDGIESKCRNRTIEENLRIFEEMKLGSAEGVKNCIRAKVSVDNPNKAMRDPVIYRCNIEHKHHRTGDKWKAYPTYDLACPLVDSKEGVTHALRSTEYTDRNPLYQWFIDTLKIRQVYMWDFSRINFVRTLMSKRKLASLVNAGTVDGWDDPRFPTIRGVRRRGLTIPALREFIIKQGPSRNVVNMDWASLWALNKKVIDPIAPRHTALVEKDIVKVTLTGADVPAEPRTEERPSHPKNKEVGTKNVIFSNELYLDQADAKTLKQGEEITAMSWGNIIIREITGTDSVTAITAELNLKGDFKTTEKKVTWLSAQGTKLVPAELWDFDYLLTKDKLEEDDKLEDFLNPVTSTMEQALCDEGVAKLKEGRHYSARSAAVSSVWDKGLADGGKVVLFAIPTGRNKKSQGSGRCCSLWGTR
ncbi:glutamyl-tRNA synthetase [Verticillium alfalfae VaMs.102]|uniref:Glutamyl-tRNA synthetase n=1 Tax=Verticillium alfalfae (strain VaMs.102 / ATCC MYA-4576 / FGSC 10136) TaxID=526221 RepID=C9SNL3_VERA1|nr:glutamyl-tRNA synthetase [Verticillium alfalfae VaMs.102]EEY20378.1 glutamyl-tRNA synthetase [Verticillium alfalfae VaMs.102]